MNLLSDKFEQPKAELPERVLDENDPRALDLFKPYQGEKVEFGLVGVGYDGAVKGRKGAREGPDAVRESLRFNSTYDYDHDVDVKDASVADFGNVVIPEGNVKEVHRAVGEAMKEIMGNCRVPMILGGDHSLTYAHVKAFCEVNTGSVGIITLDSHHDVREYEGDDVSSGTPFRRILEEIEGSPVSGKNVVQIGLHGFLNSSNQREYAISKEMMIITAEIVRNMGMESVMRGALMQAGEGTDAIFLSVDMDSVDQSAAPGVSAPSPGGLSANEFLEGLYYAGKDVKVKGMDLVEVAPNLDPSGNTARLAATGLISFLGGKVKSGE